MAQLSEQIVLDPADLGWYGTMRQSRIPDLGERFATAVARRAAELGIAFTGGVSPGDCFMVPAGTAAECLAADKLLAYIDGLADGLTGDYDNAPVEVGRKDLRVALSALESSSLMVNPEIAAALARLREAASDGQPVSS